MSSHSTRCDPPPAPTSTPGTSLEAPPQLHRPQSFEEKLYDKVSFSGFQTCKTRLVSLTVPPFCLFRVIPDICNDKPLVSETTLGPNRLCSNSILFGIWNSIIPKA
jgi:hypothetical protein